MEEQEIRYENHIMVCHQTFPTVLFIIKSGWPNRYHVIREDPEDGDYDHSHEFLSAERIATRYGIEVGDFKI